MWAAVRLMWLLFFKPGDTKIQIKREPELSVTRIAAGERNKL